MPARRNPLSGPLPDHLIASAAAEGRLIAENFANSQLAGCCYEFRVGCIAYTYDYEQKRTAQIRATTHQIHPYETITIVTKEKVSLDSSHFLLIFSKGSFFSIGLTPVCTAADPGFHGHLGITMTNLSARTICLSENQSFVKGIFFELPSPANKTYIGQHGDACMTWPYPTQFHTEPPDYSDPEAPHWRNLPLPVRSTIKLAREFRGYLKAFVWAFCILIIGLALQLVMYHIPPSPTVGQTFERIINYTGVAASIIGLRISIRSLKKTNI